MLDRATRSALLLIASVAVAGVVLWVTVEPTPPHQAGYQATTLFGDQSRPLQIDNLLRADGAALSPADFADHTTLLFFGYTSCPDICAPTLAGLVGMSHAIDDPTLQIAFASVDPERDTPLVLQDYLAYINAPILGITGSLEDMTRFARHVGAFASKTPVADSYLVDHSPTIWVIDANSQIAGVITAPLDWDDILHDLHRMLP